MIFASNGWMICAIDPNMQGGCKRHVDYFLHVISHLYIFDLVDQLKKQFLHVFAFDTTFQLHNGIRLLPGGLFVMVICNLPIFPSDLYPFLRSKS